MRQSPGPDSEKEEPGEPEQVEVQAGEGLVVEEGEGVRQLLLEINLLLLPRVLLHHQDGSNGEDHGVYRRHVEQKGGNIVQDLGVSEVRPRRHISGGVCGVVGDRGDVVRVDQQGLYWREYSGGEAESPVNKSYHFSSVLGEPSDGHHCRH